MERIHKGNGARPHCENIANDSPDAGGGSLIRFNERGMIVRLDLEYRHQTVPDIDDPGVLTRPLHDTGALMRQAAKMDLGAFVAAVLGPHHGEYAELRKGRLAAQDLADTLVFLGREPVLGNRLWRNVSRDHLDLGIQRIQESKNSRIQE